MDRDEIDCRWRELLKEWNISPKSSEEINKEWQNLIVPEDIQETTTEEINEEWQKLKDQLSIISSN